MEKPGCNSLACPCFGTVDIPSDRVLESAKQQYVRVAPVQVVSLAFFCWHQRLDFGLFAWKAPDPGKSPDVIFL